MYGAWHGRRLPRHTSSRSARPAGSKNLPHRRVWKSHRFVGWAAMWVRRAVAKDLLNSTNLSFDPFPWLMRILQFSRSTSATSMPHNSLTLHPV